MGKAERAADYGSMSEEPASQLLPKFNGTENGTDRLADHNFRQLELSALPLRCRERHCKRRRWESIDANSRKPPCEPQFHFREFLMTLGTLGRITGYSSPI